MKIGEVRLQHAQECVLRTAANSQVGPGMFPRDYRNKLKQLTRKMATSLCLSATSGEVAAVAAAAAGVAQMTGARTTTTATKTNPRWT